MRQDLGALVASAGDINNDGFGDVLIGSGASDAPAYVVFGKETGFAGVFDPSTLDGDNGFAIAGPAGGYAIGSASAADVNGDLLDDLVVSDLEGNAVHVIYGQLVDVAVTRIGSVAHQTIHGGNHDDELQGWTATTALRRRRHRHLVGGDGNDA